MSFNYSNGEALEILIYFDVPKIKFEVLSLLKMKLIPIKYILKHSRFISKKKIQSCKILVEKWLWFVVRIRKASAVWNIAMQICPYNGVYFQTLPFSLGVCIQLLSGFEA